MLKRKKQIAISIFFMGGLSLISLIIGVIGIILFVIGLINQSNQTIAMIGMISSIVTIFLAGADLFGCIIVILEEKRRNTTIKNYSLYVMATLKDSLFLNIIFLITSLIIIAMLIIFYLIL